MNPASVEVLQKRIGAMECAGSESEVRTLRVKLRDALARRAREEAARGVYRCVFCRENFVDPANGEDTCSDCVKNI